MARVTADSDAYYRVYKALHLVTHEAIPCVDNCLRVWHATQQQTLSPCTGQCPDGKKPKLPASCSNCVAWGKAIESVSYQPPTHHSPAGPQLHQPGPSQPARAQPHQLRPSQPVRPLQPTGPQPQQPGRPQITWQNVNQSNLGNSHVEVAKACVLRLPNKQATPGTQQYTSIADFDSASLLMIMARFAEFHQGDQTSYDIIKKVAGIQNELSHMGLKDDMHLEDRKVKDYFQDIEAFVTCLETLHPQHFTSAQDVKARVSEIQMEAVTAKMKEEIHVQMSVDLQLVKEEVANLKEMVKKQGTENELPLAIIHKQLKADYKSNRREMSFMPGMPKEFPVDEFFVDLTLIKEEKRPTQVKKKELVKYTDLLTLEDQRGHRLDHVLVRGEAGTGKTTMISKLAYQWATQPEPTEDAADAACDETQYPLSRFQLVFALDIRHFKPDMDLVDCIQDQLLPDSSKSAIKSLLVAHADECLFLFDGYDELNSHQRVLSSKLLLRSSVIVTTRPDKVDEFCQSYNGYIQVKIAGFSYESRLTFVTKYFETTSDETVMHRASKLLEKINCTYLDALACYPLLLAMMCFIWNETGDIPMRMTSLYKQAVEAFALQAHAKSCSAQTLTHRQKQKVNEVLLHLGSTALKGLLGRKLIFKKDDFWKPLIQIRPYNIRIGVSYICLCRLCLCVGMVLQLFLSNGLWQMLVLILSWVVISSIKINYVVNVVDDAVKLGLLTKVRGNRKGSDVTPQYAFIHKTFQEFSAAFYWSSLVKSDTLKLRRYILNIRKDNVESMEYLLRFCCGLNSEAAAVIIQHVVSHCNTEWDFQVTLLFEAELEGYVPQKLYNILKPERKLFITHHTSLEFQTILNHYLYYKKINPGIRTWLNNIQELCVSCTNKQIDQFLSKASDIDGFGKSLKSLMLEYTNLTRERTLINFVRQQIHITHLELECATSPQNPSAKSIFSNLLNKTIPTAHSQRATYFDILIPQLEHLRLVHTGMGRDQWERFLDAIIEAGKKLLAEKPTTELVPSDMPGKALCLPMRKLNLMDNYLFHSFGDDQELDKLLHKFAEALSYMPGLEYLNFADTCLNKHSLQILGPAISKLSNLEVLVLGNKKNFSDKRNILDQAGKELSQCFHNLKNLKKLNLHNTSMKDKDVSMLPLQHLPQLTKLNLSFNAFRSQGLIALSTSFEHVPQLAKVKLSIQSIESFKRTVSIVPEYAHLLQQPKLSHTETTLSVQGVTVFSSSLKHIPRLRKLDMFNRVICKQGAMSFSAALKHIPLLTHLSMTLSESECFIALSKGFCHIPKLIELVLYLNDDEDSPTCISMEATEAVFSHLYHLPDLEELRIPGIDFTGLHTNVVKTCIEEVPELQNSINLFQTDIRTIVNIVKKMS